MLKYIHVNHDERALEYRAERLVALHGPGARWAFGARVRFEKLSLKGSFLPASTAIAVAKAGLASSDLQLLDLGDAQRALVWIDGRFAAALGPGVHALWTVDREVEVEVLELRHPRLVHAKLDAMRARLDPDQVELVEVPAGHVGVLFIDGKVDDRLGPGAHAFWLGLGAVRVVAVDARAQTLDVVGQEIMSADKVTLRLNAAVSFRVKDAVLATTEVHDHGQALYRDAQLALRAVIGTRELDALLSDKDGVAATLEQDLSRRVRGYGLEVLGLGIRDVILPGDMKELMNKVTEAKKAAEAALITRREETAAARSQANTAKILEASPTLMRLRELEVLERVAEKAQLTVVLGEGGLGDRLVKML